MVRSTQQLHLKGLCNITKWYKEQPRDATYQYPRELLTLAVRGMSKIGLIHVGQKQRPHPILALPEEMLVSSEYLVWVHHWIRIFS